MDKSYDGPGEDFGGADLIDANDTARDEFLAEYGNDE